MATTDITRQNLEQTFFNVTVAVGVTPTPLSQQIQVPSQIQVFLLCNPSTNANSVFFGDQNVSLTTGIELVVGTTIQLQIIQLRQLYEIQDPDLISAQVAACQTMQGVAIPVIVWNPSNFWLIATVATNISAMIFRNVYT